MGHVISLTAVSGGLFMASVVFFFAGRGLPAAVVGLVHGGLIAACIPLYIRREKWPNGIPAQADVWLSGVSAGLYLIGLITALLPLVWASLIFLSAVVIRLAWYPFRAKDAPPGIRAAMALLMAAVLLLTVLLTILSLMSPFPAGHRILASLGWRAGVKPPPPAPTSGPDASSVRRPSIHVGGAEIPAAVIDYQLLVEKEIGGAESATLPAAISKLAVGYVAQRILERVDPSETRVLEMVRESTWQKGRVSDPAAITRIRALGEERLFLEVFVGLNGFYLHELRKAYDLGERDRLKKAALRVLGRVTEADGKPQPIESITGEPGVKMWWSTKRKAFASLFEVDEEAHEPAEPTDNVGKELWQLKPWTALAWPIPDGNASQIVRRIADAAGGRPRFEVIRVKEDGSFEAWFARESRGISVEISDETLAAEVRRLSPMIRHLVKDPPPKTGN